MRLGVLTRTLGTSQPGVLMTSQLNVLASQERDLEIVVFYADYDRIPIQPDFAMMQNRYAWDYDGSVLIAVDDESSQLLVRMPTIAKKLIYIWDPEWMFQDMPFSYSSKILQDEDVGLIARSVSHAALIERLWQTPEYIIEDFNHEQIAEICHEYGR